MNPTTQKSARSFVKISAAVALATLLAALVVSALAKPAEATFPGDNGRIAFASDRTTGEGVDNPEGDFEIFSMNPDGTGLAQLTHNAASDFDPEWSPDGEKIAFQSDRELFSNIFVMDADGADEARVTEGRSFDRSPTFSPDGGRIAFDSDLEAGEGVDNPEGDFEIFSVRTDGSGLAQLTENAEADFQADFSPDGRKLAFVSRRDFRPGIYTMKADGRRQKKVSRGPAVVFQSPSFSPDGERIAFVSDEDGPLNIFAMDADGRRQVRLTENGVRVDSAPVFSPGGNRIAFQSDRDGNFEIYKMRADGTGPVNLTNDPSGDFTPDWQPLEEQR